MSYCRDHDGMLVAHIKVKKSFKSTEKENVKILGLYSFD